VRRIIGFVLLGLGAFAIALGLLLRLYAYRELAKVPLDINSTVHLEGSNVTALEFIKQSDDSAVPEIKTGLSLTVEGKVIGDLREPEAKDGGDVAAWIEAVEVVDSSGVRVSATERLVCIDRHTNEAVQPCSGQYVQDKVDAEYKPVQEKGVFQPGLNLKFPFGTEQRSYQMYDLTLRNSAEAKFDGKDQINGLDVYRFVLEIPETRLRSEEVPGSLIGKSEPSVNADMYYKKKRTMWVEPVTGAIVKAQEVQYQELRAPGDSSGTAVFDGTLTFTDKTVEDLVNDAKENKSKLALLTTFPIYLWIGGGVAVVIAILLLFWRRGRSERLRGDPDPSQQRQLTGSSMG
jgi:Porin PorA